MRTLSLALIAGCVEYEPSSGLGADGLGEGPPTLGEVPEGSSLETFAGGSDSTVDVVVCGDTSGSMDVELRTLGETITPFVDRLATLVDDWQLVAVTDGSGCSASGLLDADTPRYADVFADALVEPVGDDDEAEMALRNVVRVLEKSGPGDCNEGLVREGTLQVVFVSDENDESPGYEESPDYWRDYVAQMQALHVDPSRVKISAVAGPAPAGCRGADPGFGFDGPVAVTGGEFLSICEDWASQIDVIADAAVLRSSFPLTDLPIPATLRVWFNDTELVGGQFSYDAASNVVNLVTPASNTDVVTIEYELAL